MNDVGAVKCRVNRQRSIYRVHYALQKREDEVMAKPLPAPFNAADVQAYGRQVAGHMKTEDQKYLGVLQCNNGTILKPIIKESQKREIDFYNAIYTSVSPDLVELRKHIPRYFGSQKFTYNGYEQEYLVLEDLAERMIEPCIMDVKIGRRTWDPLASEQKITREQSKYAACKREFGFCIPGYQVHRLPAGNLCRYDKHVGKKLQGRAVIAAIRNFLNGAGVPLCRALVLHFLSQLWVLQKWSRRQTSLQLYAGSLLLVYDANRLRECCGIPEGEHAWNQKCRTHPIARRSSIHSMHSDTGSSFSGQLSAKGPVYKKVNSVPISPMSAHSSFTRVSPVTSQWAETLARLHETHSSDHNYDEKLSMIKLQYRATLDLLADDAPNNNSWAIVKIIDFAHAFFNDDEHRVIDNNFKEGLDNFVEIFETFLRETDGQVY